MFENAKNAISAGESLISQLDYWLDNVLTQIDYYESKECLNDYEVSMKNAYIMERDLYGDVKDYVAKWVKAKF